MSSVIKIWAFLKKQFDSRQKSEKLKMILRRVIPLKLSLAPCLLLFMRKNLLMWVDCLEIKIDCLMLVFLLLTVALYDMEDEGCGNGTCIMMLVVRTGMISYQISMKEVSLLPQRSLNVSWNAIDSDLMGGHKKEIASQFRILATIKV